MANLQTRDAVKELAGLLYNNVKKTKDKKFLVFYGRDLEEPNVRPSTLNGVVVESEDKILINKEGVCNFVSYAYPGEFTYSQVMHITWEIMNMMDGEPLDEYGKPEIFKKEIIVSPDDAKHLLRSVSRDL